MVTSSHKFMNLLSRRLCSTRAILHLPKSNVYRFGDSNTAKPVFKQLEWNIRDGESWAVVGASSKSLIVQVSQPLPSSLHKQRNERRIALNWRSQNISTATKWLIPISEWKRYP
jgi:ABC-type molybdenum transport system ATPase subunit/photorepair protein PhrA